MKRQQMEIPLNDPTRTPHRVRIEKRRMQRANWWFGQMRKAVNDAAADWPPADQSDHPARQPGTPVEDPFERASVA